MVPIFQCSPYVQTPDLGALRGRDHRPSFSDRRGAHRRGMSHRLDRPQTTHRVGAGAGTGAPIRGRRVWPRGAVRRKSDPSRVAERDRRAAGHGDRVAPRDCVLMPVSRLPARTGERPSFPATAGCSRCGHGRRPRRSRRAGRTGDRFAGGAGRPRRRNAAGQAPTGQRAESVAQQPGLARSVGARDGHEGPGWHSGPSSADRLSPSRTPTRTRRPSPAPGLWTLTIPVDAKNAPTGACKTAQTRFRTAPTATFLVWLFKTGTRRNDRPPTPTTVEICSLLHDR